MIASNTEIINQRKDGAQTGDISVVTGALKFAGLLTITVLPIIAVLLMIILIRTVVKSKTAKRKNKIKIKRKYNTDKKLMKLLNKGDLAISIKPDNLDLMFDKDGYIVEVMGVQ